MGVEPQKRGRGKKPSHSPAPGTFRPAPPKGTEAVVQLFAIASRAVCAVPGNLDAITQTLAGVCQPLSSPEAETARECARMWALFARVAGLPKATLRQEAGRAFCRDLDALAQRLELPPLSEWLELPEGMSDDAFVPQDPAQQAEASGVADNGEPLAAMVAVAQRVMAQHGGKKGIPPQEAAALLGRIRIQDRGPWLDSMVGQGKLSRGDVSLLIRFLAKGLAVGASDSMLIEVLTRLVVALAES